ncbi:hypothetical protein G4177_34575 [Corallococcus sp. ZKHCc1 1396]|uniref:Lipoprotein n=1 Tax=Corallococcus soli TaxID=2710757 RepID=A0ABR9PZE6_9BACT|nr:MULTISPECIES: hypothetical protein [Corallococcus]MBE4753289.1 hypothetical protein [Corallococcus soli]MCY1035958.1 hypothetical protein [Corallococcus sp. BB11-1]RYZ47076.1 MAG: hypothetical protein EOO72_00420 [Myxococcaceae bacterium]
MLRSLCFMVLCTVGLTACGPDAVEADESFGSTQQGLACEVDTGYCRGTTNTCAWLTSNPSEGLCRPKCSPTRTCESGQTCFTQPNGQPYCNTVRL